MPVFSLDNGRLTPAVPSLSHSEEIVRETLMAVRDQVVELIYRPIFPVAWLTETSRNAGRHTSLVAMDPSGKTVTVDVVEELDTSILMGSLARASRHEEIPRGRLSGLYPRGVTAFRKDWHEFLDSCPSGLDNHPRLIILAVTVDDEVRAALDSLVGASIEVHRIDLHESRSGLLVSLEQVRPHEASFLAIGRAVRRGEIAPPSSPDDTLSDDALQLEAAPADDDADVSASTDRDTDSEKQAPADEQAPILDDGVVFVRKPERDSATAEPVSSEETAADSPAEEPVQEAPVEHESDVHSDGAGDEAVQLSPAVADQHAEQVSEASEAADDDSDRFTFRSVGFSPDGADEEPVSHAGPEAVPPTAPWAGESVTLPEVAWPERTTELQAVVDRVGEQSLSFKSLRRRVNANARLTAAGQIVLENGDTYTDPDDAASAVAGRRMDGWKNWRTADGTRLGELRQ